MEHLKQSDQKWKELTALSEDMILVVRKAFTFEVLPKMFTLGKHEGNKGFGLVSLESVQGYSYILAHPDLVMRRIRVTFRLPQQSEEVGYVTCISDLREAVKTLRLMILGFLFSFEKGGEITW